MAIANALQLKGRPKSPAPVPIHFNYDDRDMYVTWIKRYAVTLTFDL